MFLIAALALIPVAGLSTTVEQAQPTMTKQEKIMTLNAQVTALTNLLEAKAPAAKSFWKKFFKEGGYVLGTSLLTSASLAGLFGLADATKLATDKAKERNENSTNQINNLTKEYRITCGILLAIPLVVLLAIITTQAKKASNEVDIDAVKDGIRDEINNLKAEIAQLEQTPAVIS